MLKKFAGCVLASFRGSTYGLGKRLFPQAMGGRVRSNYASPLRSLRPSGAKTRLGVPRAGRVRRTVFLSILYSCVWSPEISITVALVRVKNSFSQSAKPAIV